MVNISRRSEWWRSATLIAGPCVSLLETGSRPPHGSSGWGGAPLGLRNVAFEVDDLQAALDRLAEDGYGLVGGVGQYENLWRMAYVRGPDGIIVSLAERIG
jgi:catechol 2,3-dioxygenase-like lactoylglutathione lyase family enzyme